MTIIIRIIVISYGSCYLICGIYVDLKTHCYQNILDLNPGNSHEPKYCANFPLPSSRVDMGYSSKFGSIVASCMGSHLPGNKGIIHDTYASCHTIIICTHNTDFYHKMKDFLIT